MVSSSTAALMAAGKGHITMFASAVGAIIVSGGAQQVAGSATATDTKVSSGGTQHDNAVASNTTISNGGTEVVFASDTSATILNGGAQAVVAGGTEVGATVSSSRAQRCNFGVSLDHPRQRGQAACSQAA
jgi:autotransporter passenger strand-loop-strand repeat protein